MSYEHDQVAAFREAVRIAKSQSAFARAVGCTQGNIWQLLNGERPLPGKYVLKAEEVTGVSRHRLRPDLYPPSDVPHERTVGTGAPTVACDRGAEMQRSKRP